MSLAIRIENLGKQYRVNHAAERLEYQTLREALSRAVSAPFRRLRHGPNGQCEDFWALRDISFDIRDGESVGIIGRNGAGKSTLLKILSQVTKPTTGCVRVYGRVASLLEVGTGFHPELTGRENIFLNGSILGMSRVEIRRKFDEIVEFSGVERFLDTPVKRYSSGMKVRLAFSVAAHLEPEILVIDEVLAVGDAEFQRKCLGKMGEVAQSGRTVLFVSHNMAAVQSLCNRGILLDGGSVQFQGSECEAVNEYLRVVKSTVSPGRYATPLNGSDRPQIMDARVLSGGEYSELGYHAGKPLEFEVCCHSGRTINFPALGIGIDSSMGERIVTLHSSFDSGHPLQSPTTGEFVFRCRMSGLILRPADYIVKLSFEGESGPLDVVSQAFAFTIMPTDYYHSAGDFGRGLVLCDQSWEICTPVP